MKRTKLFKKVKQALAFFTTLTLLLTSLLTTDVIASNAATDNDLIQFSSTNNTKRNVMYYGDWSIWGGQGNFYPNSIPADQLTHLNFAFLDFDQNGNLVFTDKDAAVGAPVGMPNVQWGAANAGILSAFQVLRANNPNLRIGVSLGGWSKSGDFSTVAANPNLRKNLANNLAKFVKYTNMDFVDVDWEYPASQREPDKVDNTNDEGTPNASAADKENFILLLQDLRSALDAQGEELGRIYELTVAISASKASLAQGVDIPRLFEVVDFANIMTYDMHGAWDTISGHHTGLYTNPNDPYKDAGLSVHDSVQYLISQGAPSNKIVIGAAFYTRGWENVSAGPDSTLPGLFGEAAIAGKDADQTPTRGAGNEAPLKSGEGGRRGGVWNYGSLDKLKSTYPGLVEYWDDYAKAPYLYNPSTGAFFTYDNQRSLREKTSYVLENNLGGVISWMASSDAETTTPGVRDELTKTIKEGLFGSEPLQKYMIGTSSIDVSLTIIPYQDSAAKGYEITIRNNATKNESGDVLSLVEIAGETIKLPKLYIQTSSKSSFASGGYGSGVVTNENGIAVVDLSTVYDNQTIGHGSSCTFKIATTGPATIEDVLSIELSQRIYASGTEISKDLVYGDSVTNPTDPVDPVDPVENQLPIIYGANNITIDQHSTFDSLSGVTAQDSEDGNLTSSITVHGTVDTAIAKTYLLTYTVTDSNGGAATVTRTVIVKAIPASTDTFDPNKIYTTGDIVIYNGDTYVCNWWTLGESPDTSAAWTLQVTPNEDGSVEYKPGGVYLAGDKVTYQGSLYEANWWTQSIPGSDSSWKLLSPTTPTDPTDPTDPDNPFIPGDPVAGTTDFKIVGYYPSWQPAKINSIQYNNLTHINYAFAIPTSDGSLLPLENPATATAIITEAHKNNVKVLLAIGGWSYNGTPLEATFMAATNTPEKTVKFGDAIIAMAKQYGFDGIDMDWEHPRNDSTSKQQYENLMVYLSKELKKDNMLLTSAVLSGVNSDGIIYWDSAAHTDTVIQCVDWFNVMAYDGGDGDRHSSYEFAVNCGNYWKNTRQMPANKVVLGVPFYGRPSWAAYSDILLANPNAYNTDISVINGMEAHYNGIPTIQRKTNWALDNVGGIMIWEISQDTTDLSKSLLNTIGNAVRDAK